MNNETTNAPQMGECPCPLPSCPVRAPWPTDRLRGEAAQGEQQAVAIPTPDQIERHTNKAGECPPQSLVMLVSSIKRLQQRDACPQPVAVAGDAVRALREISEFKGDPQTPVRNAVNMRGIARAALRLAAAPEARCQWPDCGHDTNQSNPEPGCNGKFCGEEKRAALSAAPAAPACTCPQGHVPSFTLTDKACPQHAAAPAPVAGDAELTQRAINRDFVEAVKQLCRDYSCRQNRPYMADVLAQLDYLPEQLGMTVASLPVAGDAVDFDAIQHILKHALRDGVHGGYTARFIEAQIAALAQDRASQAGAAGVPESAREVIEMLLQVAYRADVATDDSEDLGDGAGHNVGDAEFAELCSAIEALEALPDDQPGYVMGPVAKARWALRDMLAVAPTPAAEGEVRNG